MWRLALESTDRFEPQSLAQRAFLVFCGPVVPIRSMRRAQSRERGPLAPDIQVICFLPQLRLMSDARSPHPLSVCSILEFHDHPLSARTISNPGEILR